MVPRQNTSPLLEKPTSKPGCSKEVHLEHDTHLKSWGSFSTSETQHEERPRSVVIWASVCHRLLGRWQFVLCSRRLLDWENSLEASTVSPRNARDWFPSTKTKGGCVQ